MGYGGGIDVDKTIVKQLIKTTIWEWFMVYTTHLWLGGWFIIVLPTLGQKNSAQELKSNGGVFIYIYIIVVLY